MSYNSSHGKDQGQNRGGTPEYIKKIQEARNLSEISVEEVAKEDGIAESAAKSFGKNLKPTQLRKFFDQAKSIEAGLKEDGWESVSANFAMLRPSLAYAKGRKVIPDDFYLFISSCMAKVLAPDGNMEMTKENYTRFIQILESVVAYNKYHFKE